MFYNFFVSALDLIGALEQKAPEPMWMRKKSLTLALFIQDSF
jgi:hypothetical protein